MQRNFILKQQPYLLRHCLTECVCFRLETTSFPFVPNMCPANEPADTLHAATCLQESAILITNDKHFDQKRD